MRACAEEWRRRGRADVAWDARSLTAFGDQPVEEVANRYDLLVIDHPFCGRAEASGALRPLGELLGREELAVLAADSVGASHDSYTFNGSQWALAADAACQVSAFRPDLLEAGELPDTWDRVLALAREVGPRVALPLAPPHAFCSFLTLCANAGRSPASSSGALVDPDVGTWALGLLGELAALGPSAALAWEPPQALEQLTQTDELVYVPITFGYVSYSHGGQAARPCRFVDIPSAGNGPVGSILGGAGLAVSATSEHPDESADFAAWASGAEAQRAIVGRTGGQPASRTAWDDPDLDAAAGGFFSGTLATIQSAWMRPREAWWPAFQLEAGRALTQGLSAGTEPRRLLAGIEELYVSGRAL